MENSVIITAENITLRSGILFSFLLFFSCCISGFSWTHVIYLKPYLKLSRNTNQVFMSSHAKMLLRIYYSGDKFYIKTRFKFYEIKVTVCLILFFHLLFVLSLGNDSVATVNPKMYRYRIVIGTQTHDMHTHTLRPTHIYFFESVNNNFWKLNYEFKTQGKWNIYWNLCYCSSWGLLLFLIFLFLVMYIDMANH